MLFLRKPQGDFFEIEKIYGTFIEKAKACVFKPKKSFFCECLESMRLPGDDRKSLRSIDDKSLDSKSVAFQKWTHPSLQNDEALLNVGINGLYTKILLDLFPESSQWSHGGIPLLLQARDFKKNLVSLEGWDQYKLWINMLYGMILQPNPPVYILNHTRSQFLTVFRNRLVEYQNHIIEQLSKYGQVVAVDLDEFYVRLNSSLPVTEIEKQLGFDDDFKFEQILNSGKIR